MKKFHVVLLAAVVMSAVSGCAFKCGKCACDSWEGKKVLVLGDSITDPALRKRWKNYWAYLPEMLGIIPEVYGKNGHQWTGILKQAQKARAEKGDEIDAVFIFAGTNDFNGGVPLGEWYDVKDAETNRTGKSVVLPRRNLVKDMATFKGRLNTVLEYLKTEFPDAQIVMFTPIHRAFFTCAKTNVQPDESFPNLRGLYVDQYCDAICEAGKIWSVPVIDLYGESGLCPRIGNQGVLFADPEKDRLHPSSEGHRRIALLLAAKLRTLPPTFKQSR